jgi:hypothetical protein
MATRKDGKTPIRLSGGPFAGVSFPMTPPGRSMSFKCKNFFGHYADGRWKSEIVDAVLDVSPNFILGYN